MITLFPSSPFACLPFLFSLLLVANLLTTLRISQFGFSFFFVQCSLFLPLILLSFILYQMTQECIFLFRLIRVAYQLVYHMVFNSCSRFHWSLRDSFPASLNKQRSTIICSRLRYLDLTTCWSNPFSFWKLPPENDQWFFSLIHLL